MKAVISNNLIPKLKPKDKQYDVRDTKLKGFLIRVTPNGKMSYVCQYKRGRRINIGTVEVMTPAQARDRAKEILADSIKGIEPQTKINAKTTNNNLKDFIENEYGPWRYANRKGASKDTPRLKKKFADNFPNLSLNEVTPLLLDKWRSQRIKDGIKIVTINRDISVIKAMMNKAVEWGIIEKNPLQAFKLSVIDSISKVRYLSKDEEINLIKALELRDENLKAARSRGNEWKIERNHPPLPDLYQYNYADHLTPMVILSLNTGLRQGELFKLRWENIIFDRAILTIPGYNAKSGKTRHLPLNSVALKVILNWQKQSNSSGLVFSGKNPDEPFDNVKKAWTSLLVSAEISNFRWHDMRHHFASKLVMAGVDLNTVRELLGHADIKMTLRYAHLAPEHKANAVEKLVTNTINF